LKVSTTETNENKNLLQKLNVPPFFQIVCSLVGMAHTALIIVAVVVIENDKILMIEEAKPECYGTWYLPGRFLKNFAKAQKIFLHFFR
jgi:hypothetical protein